jgi:hypothetical protein
MLPFEREGFAEEALCERGVTEPEMRETAKECVLGALLRGKVRGFWLEFLECTSCRRQLPLVEGLARSVEACPAGAEEEHSSG